MFVLAICDLDERNRSRSAADVGELDRRQLLQPIKRRKLLKLNRLGLNVDFDLIDDRIHFFSPIRAGCCIGLALSFAALLSRMSLFDLTSARVAMTRFGYVEGSGRGWKQISRG